MSSLYITLDNLGTPTQMIFWIFMGRPLDVYWRVSTFPWSGSLIIIVHVWKGGHDTWNDVLVGVGKGAIKGIEPLVRAGSLWPLLTPPLVLGRWPKQKEKQIIKLGCEKSFVHGHHAEHCWRCSDLMWSPHTLEIFDLFGTYYKTSLVAWCEILFSQVVTESLPGHVVEHKVPRPMIHIITKFPTKRFHIVVMYLANDFTSLQSSPPNDFMSL